jgi:hypothetical protein
MRHSCRPLLAICACAVCITSCASPERQADWSRHLDVDVWTGGLERQWQRPDRVVPEAFLAASVPVGLVFDHDIRRHEESREVSPGTKHAADSLQVILPAAALGVSGYRWAHGDDGQNFEVAAEALAVVPLVTKILKVSVGTVRPTSSGGTLHESFPSGHASFAFAATTLLVRDLHDPADDSFKPLDMLLYAPAAFAAYERVAISKHWTSDVTAGAFLGVFLTNWIWDMHVSDGTPRTTIFEPSQNKGIAWRPRTDVVDDGLAFGVELAF